MTILLGLMFATLLVWGWACGSVLVAIFLTLGELAGMTLIGLFKDGNPTLQGIAVGAFFVIWLPVFIRSQLTRAKPKPTRDPLSLTIRS